MSEFPNNPAFATPEPSPEDKLFPTGHVDVAESAVYIDPSETAETIDELQKLKTKFMLSNMKPVEGDFGFNIMQNRFFAALKARGVTDEELQNTRLYHLLIGSTMSADMPPAQFDVAGGAIEHFIRTQGAEYK